MKRILFFTSALLLFCGVVFSQNSNGFLYLQNRDGGITITGYTGSDRNIVVPASIGGVPVIAIGNRAFRNQGITSVTLPESVESIGVMAFAENDISVLTLPVGVRLIEVGAFSSNRIEELSIPDSVAVIRYNAFGKNPVRRVRLSRNVRAVNPRVFTQNDLERISLGGGVEIYLGNFDRGFVNYYGSQERQGGDYERRGGVWVLTE